MFIKSLEWFLLTNFFSVLKFRLTIKSRASSQAFNGLKKESARVGRASC